MTNTQRRAAMYSNIRSAIYIAIRNLDGEKLRGPEHNALLRILADTDDAEIVMRFEERQAELYETHMTEEARAERGL